MGREGHTNGSAEDEEAAQQKICHPMVVSLSPARGCAVEQLKEMIQAENNLPGNQIALPDCSQQCGVLRRNFLLGLGCFRPGVITELGHCVLLSVTS